jgi:hypothetical protein
VSEDLDGDDGRTFGSGSTKNIPVPTITLAPLNVGSGAGGGVTGGGVKVMKGSLYGGADIEVAGGGVDGAAARAKVQVMSALHHNN